MTNVVTYSNAFLNLHHSVKLSSTISHSSSSAAPAFLIHKESMYNWSPISKSVTSRSTSTSTSTSTSIKSANLITFDLDDTIFPVGPVVQDANEALITHLTDECGYDTITQESLIASTKKIRTELKNNDNKVITYTELRQRAICEEINQHQRQKQQQQQQKEMVLMTDENNNEVEMEDLDEWSNIKILSHTDDIVVKAYGIWETNRHIAAERHLYHDTIEMLQSLKEQYPNAIIGAITNGKGNPLKMTNTIHNYFDFCVSGEDDDVFPNRKPNEGIYLKSLERFYDLTGNDHDDDEHSSNAESFNWFHIGDDLANDVGASSKCGALAIWVDLNHEAYNQSASKRFVDNNYASKNQNDDQQSSSSGSSTTSSRSEDVAQQQPFWSTATKDEIEKRKKLNAESMQYVSARIESLSCLAETISTLLPTQNV